MADGVETVVVTGEAIGSLIHQMGHPALGRQGRPGWRSLVVVVYKIAGVGSRADWMFVKIAAERLVK